MNLSQAYLEWREATLQEGVQQGQRQVVENLLRIRFGSLNEELEQVIINLHIWLKNRAA